MFVVVLQTLGAGAEIPCLLIYIVVFHLEHECNFNLVIVSGKILYPNDTQDWRYDIQKIYIISSKY